MCARRANQSKNWMIRTAVLFRSLSFDKGNEVWRDLYEGEAVMKSEKTIVAKRFMPALEAVYLATGMEQIRKNTGRVRFPVYSSTEFDALDIEQLELSARANNCLRRVDIHTIGDLVDRVESENGLNKIRNCGKTSVTEIMLSLLCFQYERLSTEQRKRYVARIRELN